MNLTPSALRVFCLLLTLFTLGLVTLSGYILWQQPFPGFVFEPTESYKVTEIEPSAPVAETDIRIGDRVVEIDGTPIQKLSPLYDLRKEHRKPGDIVYYSIRRGEERKRIAVPMKEPTLWDLFRHFEPLLIGLAFWLIGLLVALFTRRVGTKELLFLLCTQLAACILALGSLTMFQVQWAWLLLNACIGLASPVLIHFHLRFPSPKEVPYRGLLLSLSYGLGCALALLPSFRQEEFITSYGAPWFYFLFSLSVGLLLMGHSYLFPPSPEVRGKIRVIVLGSFLAFSPLLFLSLAPDMVLGQFLLPYELTLLPLSLVPFLYAYAIRRHDLMQMDFVIRRSLTLLLIAFVSVGFYLLLIQSLASLYPRFTDYQPLSGALMALLVAFPLPFLRERFQVMVDRALYGDWYNPRQVVGRFSHALSEALEVEEFTRLMVEDLARELKLKMVALLLPEEKGDFILQRASGVNEPSVGSRRMASKGPLVRELERVQGAIKVWDLARRWGDSAELAAWPEGQVWLPLNAGGQLRGVLILGAKSGQDSYRREDFWVLDMLAHQAAVAVENVLLVQELRESLEERDRLYRQLVRVREEERKRLSLELHDEVIQDLTGLRYDLVAIERGIEIQAALSGLRQIEDRVGGAISRLRRVCADLRPLALDDLGLLSVLQQYVAEFADQTSISARFHFQGSDERLPAEISLDLFRSVQEALSNVRKHAEAQRVEVSLRISPRELVLTIEDDGRGFEKPSSFGVFTRQRHFGLANVQERVRIIGGRLDIESHPGRGTKLTVEVPLGKGAG